MKSLKSNISITLDNDVIEMLKEFAEKEDRSLSSYINILLKEHIKSKENNI